MAMPPTPSTQRVPAIFWLIAATLVWGVSFPLIRVLHFNQANVASCVFLSSGLLGLRFLFSGAILCCIRPKWLFSATKLEWQQATWLAVWAGPGLILQANGLSDTDASISAFLTQFYCILLPLWICLRSRRWPTSRVVVATLLVLLGIAKLSGVTWEKCYLGWGAWQTLLATVFFTVQILVLENPKYAVNRSGSVSLLMFLVMAAIGLVAAFASMEAWSDWSRAWGAPSTWGILAVITLGCTLFSYMCMNHWQPHVSSVEAGLIYCLEPVSTATFGLFLPALLSGWCGVYYPNESHGWPLLIGGGLVLLANIVLLVKPKTRV